MDFDTRKTLEELEDSDWGELPDNPSYLVQTVYSLRRKPLQNFTAEDLRIVIGQNLSLEFLVPVAMEMLALEPWVKTDMGTGSLLRYALNLSPDFWTDHPDLWRRMKSVLEHALADLPDLDEWDKAEMKEEGMAEKILCVLDAYRE